MDTDHFVFVRRLTRGLSRRRGLGLLASLGLAGPIILDAAEAKNKSKNKNKKKHCPPCKKRKQGKCRKKTNGTACGSGRICQGGRCVCPSGLTNCGEICLDTQTDEANCGTCGTVCPATQVCQAGSCFPASTCSASTTNYCAPLSPACGTGLTACFCGRSAEGNVVCLHDEDELCMTAPLCQTSAGCPPGEACVDVQGCCASDPAGSKRCLARCPAPAA